MTGTSANAPKLVMPRGPVPDIEPLTDEEEQILARGAATNRSEKLDGQLAGVHINDAAPGLGDGDLSSEQKIERRTTYEDENKKWYKAAKKAEKKAGAANMHLALS